MERAMLLALLARAERHIALGKEQINNQYRIIAKLERDGHDTAAAVELLKHFIETQQDNEQDRDRLMSKLANASPGADRGASRSSFFRAQTLGALRVRPA